MFGKQYRGAAARDALPVEEGRKKMRSQEEDGDVVSRHGSNAQFRDLDADVSGETTKEDGATVETTPQSAAAEAATSTTPTSLGMGDIARLLQDVTDATDVHSERGIDGEQGLTTIARGEVVRVTRPLVNQSHVETASGVNAVVANNALEVDPNLRFGGPREPSPRDRANRLLDRELGLGRRDNGGKGQGTAGSSMQDGRPRIGYTKADVDRTVALLMEKYAYKNMPGSLAEGVDADAPGGYIPKTRHIIAMLDHGATPEIIFKLWDDFVAKFPGETLHERAFDAVMFNHDGSQEIYMQWLYGFTPGS